MARTKGSKGPAAAKRPPLTHFLCIPLVTSTSRTQLERSIAQLRDETAPAEPRIDREIQHGKDGKGEVTLSTIPPKAIRPVGSLHLTIGVMSLNEDRLVEAVDCLQGNEVGDLIANSLSSQNETSTHQLTINMKGLASMHSARQTSILYCPPADASGRLQPFCESLQNLFKEKGFVSEDTRPLKLHATIVNTIYAKGSRSAGHGPNAKAPVKLDATVLLEKYKDFVWADDVVLNRVAICEMGAKKIYDAQGEEVGAEYTEVATISLPS